MHKRFIKPSQLYRLNAKMSKPLKNLILTGKLRYNKVAFKALFLYFLIWDIHAHAGAGDTYFCKTLQGLKVTEKIQKLKIQPFKLIWLDDTIKIENGPVLNKYNYDLVYQNKNSFTASNSTLSAVIRFSETQNEAYLTFTFLNDSSRVR